MFVIADLQTAFHVEYVGVTQPPIQWIPGGKAAGAWNW
jgi:hypothetical protein